MVSDRPGLLVSRMTSEVSPVRMRLIIHTAQLLDHVCQVGKTIGVTLVWVLKRELVFIHVACLKQKHTYAKRAEVNIAGVTVCEHVLSWFGYLCLRWGWRNKVNKGVDVCAAASRQTWSEEFDSFTNKLFCFFALIFQRAQRTSDSDVRG